jgi:hypothetical protein
MLEILERDENAVTSQSADIAEEAAERWTVRVNSEIPKRARQIAAFSEMSMGDLLVRLVDNAFEEYVKELSVKPG